MTAKGDSLFAQALSGGVTYVSPDQGETWNFYYEPEISSVLNPVGIDGFFVRGNFGELIELNPATQSRRVLFETQNVGTELVGYKDTMLIAAVDSIYASFDHGVTWRNQSEGLPASFWVSSFLHHRGKIYASLGNEIYVTEDQLTSSWIKLSSPGPSPGLHVWSLIGDNDYIFAGTTEGVYFSPDNGYTWIEYNDESTSPLDVKALEIKDNLLIAGTSESVWASPMNELGPEISSFEPMSGVPGTTVTIHGKNFSSEPAMNSIEINGVKAEVIFSTTMTMMIEIPANASSGKFTLTLNNAAAESPEIFCVGAIPVIVESETQNGLPVLTSDVTENIQWYRNGELIQGAVNATYEVTDTGIYSVRADEGTCTFEAFHEISCEDNDPVISMTMSEAGLPVLTSDVTDNVQWYRNGQILEGAVSANYAVSEKGVYSVRVTNGLCVTEAFYEVPCVHLTAAISISTTETGSITLHSSVVDNVQWYKDGAIIADAAGPDHEVTESGNYSVRVTDGECETETFYSLIITEIEQSARKIHLNVVPNPVGDILRIELENFDSWGLIFITVYDQLGSAHMAIQLSGTRRIDLDARPLPPGVYVVRASQGSFTKSVRILKR